MCLVILKRSWVALFAPLLFACATAYQPRGATGGFAETRITANSYRVEFSGNGNTSEETVWNYWIYRCAEFSEAKGFDLFNVQIEEKSKPVAKNSSNFSTMLSLDSDAEGLAVNYAAHVSGPIYIPIYGSGGQITRYTAYGIINMFHSDKDSIPNGALKARSIIQTLKEYVTSGAKTKPPSRADTIKSALYFLQSKSSGMAVTLDDLRYLLPQSVPEVSSSDKKSAQRMWIDLTKEKIRSNLVMPPNTPSTSRTIVSVIQLPSGEVLRATIKQSSGFPLYDEAVQRAVLKSSPFPAMPSAEMFVREIEFVVTP